MISRTAGGNWPTKRLQVTCALERRFSICRWRAVIQGCCSPRSHGSVSENLISKLWRTGIDVASEFPEAAIPHFRIDTVLSNLGDRGEEAAAEAQQALALIDADPFLSTRQHWVRSTIKRRVAARYMEQAEELREQFESGGSNEQLRRKYLDLLLQSFRIVYSGYPDEVAPSHDNFFELEARRRVNNIAYYASLILEQPGGPARMDAMNFGQRRPARFGRETEPVGYSRSDRRQHCAHDWICA